MIIITLSKVTKHPFANKTSKTFKNSSKLKYQCVPLTCYLKLFELKVTEAKNIKINSIDCCDNKEKIPFKLQI